MTEDIYNNGTYIKNNPNIHSEDVKYKFFYIKDMLTTLLCNTHKRKLSILDIGGGCGELGKLVCDFLIQENCQISFDALDLSKEMLQIQKKTNPYLALTFHVPIEEINKYYDLILLIDVIEHIPDYLAFTRLIQTKASHVIFNIPIEKNLFDFAKNLYFKGQYYKWQEASLGHLHFFSYHSAMRYLSKNFKILDTKYPLYAQHILTTDSGEYIKQRQNKMRYLELQISNWIAKYLKFIAPLIVQGSLFAIVETVSND